MLAAGMAHGAIIYHSANQTVDTSSSGYQFDLNGDATNDFNVLFDGNNSVKPCVVGSYISSGSYPGTFPNPTPYVLNELDMNPTYPTDPANNDYNGIPLIPAGTTITSQVTLDTNTISIGDLGGDMHGKNEGYLYQNGETTVVGQWPSDQVSTGYVGLALVDTNSTPATTNYGWVQVEWNPTNQPNPTLTVIDYAYQTIANSNIVTGQIPLSPPSISESPANQTVVAGSTIAMKVVASGNPAPCYQWMAGAVGSGIYTNLPNAGEFAGVNTAILTISNVTPADQLDYMVAVTNTLGSTNSLPATLTVLGAGMTGPVPDRQVIYAGYPARFTVTDLGGGARTNVWKRNGTTLSDGGGYSGTSTTNLMISSVSTANTGNYQAIERTAYGAVTNSITPLGIAYPDGSLYEAAVRAYGAVDYYRLNETSGTNAWDFIGGKTGTYNSPGMSVGDSGPTSSAGFPGFVSTNYSADFQADGTIDTNAYITCLPWNLNTNTVTLTAWINPSFQEGNSSGLNCGILFTVGTGNMICGIRYDGTYSNTNGINDANIGYSWNNDYGAGQWNSGITAPHNEWSLVALAVSPTNATLYIINNSLGVQSSVDTRNHDPALFNATEYIGTYPLEAPLGDNNFSGYIDEVAIFNSTLSSNQVYSLYESALGQDVVPPALTITPAGANSQVRWTSGVLLQATNILGPWTTNTAATSPYTINPASPQQFFRAKQ